jgi:hypothetical protein
MMVTTTTMMMTPLLFLVDQLQWDLLTEFAKGQNATELVLDCAWKIGDWNSMRDALARYAGAASDTPQLKYYLHPPLTRCAVHQGCAACCGGACLWWRGGTLRACTLPANLSAYLPVCLSVCLSGCLLCVPIYLSLYIYI